ncbi:hypothetical protein Tco_0002082 [Tanacetum coccineum]
MQLKQIPAFNFFCASLESITAIEKLRRSSGERGSGGGNSPMFGSGTDISKITRKQSKAGKHGHEKWKSTREAKDSKPKPEKVNPQSALVNLDYSSEEQQDSKDKLVKSSILIGSLMPCGLKEAQEMTIFTLESLTQQAQMSLSWIATLAIRVLLGVDPGQAQRGGLWADSEGTSSVFNKYSFVWCALASLLAAWITARTNSSSLGNLAQSLEAFSCLRKTSSGSSEVIASITSMLDSLGRDMKKLKENVHAIQVGCGIYEGAHLDKDCPLNKEVKRVKEVVYGEFGRSFPNNGVNKGRCHVGLPGYCTHVENLLQFGKRKPSLKERMNKHIKESTRRRNENEKWVKKL